MLPPGVNVREHHHLILTLTLYNHYCALSLLATEITTILQNLMKETSSFFGCGWKNSIVVDLHCKTGLS